MDIGIVIKNACSSVLCRDEAGVKYEIRSGIKNSFIELVQEVFYNENGVAEMRLCIRNISGKKLFIERGTVLDISDSDGAKLDLDGRINGWTMLTADLGKGVSDLCNSCHNENKLDYYSPYYTALGNRKSGKYAFFGFVTCSRQHCEMELSAVGGFKFKSLKAFCDFCGAPLAAGAEFKTEILYVNVVDGPSEALEKYFELLLGKLDRNLTHFQDIIGWATWDYYQSHITEADILKNVEWLSARRDTIPVKYIQLDHGFQHCEGDWLNTNEKFPHDLKWLAAEIKSKGFKPGLWLCPFLVAPESKVYKAHPDWVVKTADGGPLEVAGYAVSKVYALDCSIPAVLDWLKELAKTVTYDYGYEYVKLDGANAQGMSPLGVLADSSITKGEAMRRGLLAFKEGMSETAFLLNACLFGLSLGAIDGMRIGEDVGGRWDSSKIDKHHGERDGFNGPGEVLRAIAATLNHYHQHKKLWINDPDYLVVRQKGSNSELSYEEARTWATVVGLSNGLVMLSDNLPELEPERVSLIEKVLPHYKRMAKPVDFFKKNVPSFYHLQCDNSSEKWDVVCVLNGDYPARTREYELKFTEIGLADNEEFHVFDFWNSSYKGSFKGAVKVSVDAHSCVLLAIRRKLDLPQILSTDIHITQGGLEIESSEFRNGTLSIKTAACGRSGNCFIYIPENFKIMDTGLLKISENVWRMPLTLDGTVKTIKFA